MKRSTIAILAAAVCLGFVAAQEDTEQGDFGDYGEEFEGGYDAYYDEYNYGNWYNEDYDEEMNYYNDGYEEYGNYEDPYAQYEYGYMDDALYDYPEDYYMDYDYFDQAPDCEIDEAGKTVFKGLGACDIKISGADKVLDKLKGGMDGVYEITGCHGGRPLFQRKGNEPKRLLWYSALYKDWDFNDGDTVVESDILGYGGDGIAEQRPQFIPSEKWNLLAEYSSKNTDLLKDFVQVNLKIECADGSNIDQPADDHPQAVKKAVTLLTDEEWEDRYSKIYKKFQKKQEPRINTVFVAFIVLSGISIVLGIPYMVFFKKGKKSKAYSLLNQSRKQMAGKL